ncbi:MAG: hypothetical protein LAO09_06765 [Acidobacteriia bacterium]|nr:hypothetical protein [Terriglobia bacterium]
MTGLQVPRQLCRSVVTSLLYQLMFLLPWVSPLFGQSPAPTADIPHWVRFSGTLRDAQGNPRSGVVGATFALYKEEQGGTALWLETQNVQADSSGHYTMFLGVTKSGGLPQELFVSGEARWLGVQPEGQAEQPRTLLLSVPYAYALKAGDAQTVGGLPPSAFVLAAPAGTGSTSTSNTIERKPPLIARQASQSLLTYWQRSPAIEGSTKNPGA